MQREKMKHLLKGVSRCVGRLRQEDPKFEANFSCDSQLQDSSIFFSKSVTKEYETR